MGQPTPLPDKDSKDKEYIYINIYTQDWINNQQHLEALNIMANIIKKVSEMRS